MKKRLQSYRKENHLKYMDDLTIMKIYCCISIIQLYVYVYNYMGKYSEHNIRISMNERTHFFIKIYFSHCTRKGWCCLCVRGELERETDCHVLTQSSSPDHSSTSSSFWLGCSTVGHWRPKPSVWSWFSLCRHPISNCDWNWLTGTATRTASNSSRLRHLVI